MMYYWSNGMHNGWYMPGLFFVMFIFWVILIALAIIFIVRSMRHNHYDQYRHSSIDALEILKQRYAKGEINKQEYEQIKKDIKD